ncbi:MAG TPA: GNAT family N-acetyltransferase [Pseudonocardia sp.]
MIRSATPDDVPEMVAMVHELADYEHAAQSCHLSEAQLADALFGPSPALFGHVAHLDGATAGCALWFRNFSTWRGTHGIHLEDLFVRPEFRGRGVGRALLAGLAAACVERGYGRLEWAVLDWNEPAIGFYRALGAAAVEDWLTFRLDGQALTSLASTGPSPTSGTAR